jgi:hypothetical protein
MISISIGKETITVEQGTTIAQLRQLYPNTKFIHKGKILDDDSVLTDGTKLFVIRHSEKELADIQEKETKYEKGRENYEKYAVKPKYEKPRSYNIEVLPGFNDQQKAKDLLYRIWDDVGIRQIMAKRNWVLGKLIELHPDQRSILGYNQNKGQVIALRLRTDDLSGFRYFESIVKVMLHELAHFEFGDHDEHFHQLNRQLNKEYEMYKGHLLGKAHAAPNSIEQPTSFVLGGSRPEGNMREVLLKAAITRLSKEEQEITDACGQKKP